MEKNQFVVVLAHLCALCAHNAAIVLEYFEHGEAIKNLTVLVFGHLGHYALEAFHRLRGVGEEEAK